MKITNKLNLPESILYACQHDDYTKGNADYSITQLLNPPQQSFLAHNFKSLLIQDASERLYALMGKAMHAILEKSDKNAITEKRMYMDFMGKTISGQTDRFYYQNNTNKVVIQDYKFASVWEYIYGLKPEREQQLNLYAELLRQNNYSVCGLEIIFLFRDWLKSKARYDNNYPQTQMAKIKVNLWLKDKALKFLEKRLKEFSKNPIPECTKIDKWTRNEKWAIMKKGQKKATKLFDNKKDAEKKLDELEDLYYIEYRKGQDVKCEDYCIVREFCPQRKRGE
jgi:hypothetical protein